ncbi:MAG: hypothetical protein ACJ75G_07545 [Gaiellaceae bacterium]
MTRLAWLLAALGVLATLAACGASHHARPYTGRLYSVEQVKEAFASLGLELHRADTPAPGVALLVNNRRLGPQHIPSPPRVVTVVVIRQPLKAKSTPSPPRHARVTKYANVTAFSARSSFLINEVRGAVSALRWGTTPPKPRRRLIGLADSIGGIRLGESRQSVEMAFGPGRSEHRGLVRYFGGHLLVNYWFHDGLYKYVEYLQTRWGGYHTRSGVHVGSSRKDLRPLFVSCERKPECWLQAGPTPDPVGTVFTVRHGKVVEIEVGSFG